ncbi:MAG: alpha/beta hydrolase-fold protein [Firmicutes bacterium]|nr:alpha/beta hydrolase-fold protein [Bacillota bacterium]
MKNGQMETVLYPVAGREEEALVFIPNDYSALYKYGLLLLFDGLDYWRQGRLSRVISDHFGGRLPFLIALLPVDAAQRTQTYGLSSDTGARTRHTALLHAVAGPLLRTMEQRFTLMPIRGARAIGGSSLGAAMALSMIVHYPRRFGHFYGQSPAFRGELCTRLSDAPPDFLTGLDAHVIVGENEGPSTDARDFISEAQACTDALSRAGAQVEQIIRPGGHGWDAWQGDLPALLTAFSKSLSFREDRS